MDGALPNNPAGRLLRFLEIADKERGQIAHLTSAQGFSRVLGVNADDRPRLLKAVADLYLLPDEVAKALRRVPKINPDRYTAWISNFLKPLAEGGAGVQFAHFIGPVDKMMLSVVAIADDLLSANCPEPTADEARLDKLREDLNHFIRSIEEAQLPTDQHEYLMRYVQILDVALLSYRFQGFKALQHGLESAVGHTALNRVVGESVNANPAAEQPRQKLWSLLAALLLLVNVPLNTIQLTHEVRTLLPHSPTGDAKAHAAGGPEATIMPSEGASRTPSPG